MYKLGNITNDYKQNIEWLTEDGQSVYLYLEYLPNQLGWFLGIKYGDDIDYKNIRITNTLNLLRSYRAYLPFGILCTTEDNLEPMGLDDFATGYASIYMLTKLECSKVEDDYYAKVSA